MWATPVSRERISAVAMFAALSLLTFANLAPASEQAGHPFSWLAGCWAGDGGSATEVWVIEDDGSLLGFAASVGEGKIGFYELLTIRQSDGGVWVYTAHPSGQATTSFTLTLLSDDAAVFENAGHDYPQVIRYERSGDRLEATISLSDGSRTATFRKRLCEKDQPG